MRGELGAILRAARAAVPVRPAGAVRALTRCGYAPDLNPVEGLWGNLKGRELANLCAGCRRGIARVRRRPALRFAFLCHTGLCL